MEIYYQILGDPFGGGAKPGAPGSNPPGSTAPTQGEIDRTQTNPVPTPTKNTKIDEKDINKETDRNQKFIKDFVAKFNRYPYETEYEYFIKTGQIVDLNPQKTKDLNPVSESNTTNLLLLGGGILLALKIFKVI